MAGRASIGAKCMALSWSSKQISPWFEHSIEQFCYAAFNFDKRSYQSLPSCWICATYAKTPLSLISHWNKENNVDFWQPPDISRSHLYHRTIPWTPTTAIYWEYTVLICCVGKTACIVVPELISCTWVKPKDMIQNVGQVKSKILFKRWLHLLKLHIKAVTKWPQLCRWHFLINCLVWELMYFASNVTKICSQWSNQ